MGSLHPSGSPDTGFHGDGSRAVALGDVEIAQAVALQPTERLGVVKPSELDPASMADELREEVGAAAGTVAAPPMVGAWVRV